MIRSFNPSGKRDHPPRGIKTMLRMYLMQIWFSLSDEGMKDAIYDSYTMRSFLHISDVNSRLEAAGLIMHGGTIVDATLIAALPSTKNKEGSGMKRCTKSKKENRGTLA